MSLFHGSGGGAARSARGLVAAGSRSVGIAAEPGSFVPRGASPKGGIRDLALGCCPRPRTARLRTSPGSCSRPGVIAWAFGCRHGQRGAGAAGRLLPLVPLPGGSRTSGAELFFSPCSVDFPPPFPQLSFFLSPSFRRPSSLFLSVPGLHLLFPDPFCAASKRGSVPGLSFLPQPGVPRPAAPCGEGLPAGKSRRPRTVLRGR